MVGSVGQLQTHLLVMHAARVRDLGGAEQLGGGARDSGPVSNILALGRDSEYTGIHFIMFKMK